MSLALQLFRAGVITAGSLHITLNHVWPSLWMQFQDYYSVKMGRQDKLDEADLLCDRLGISQEVRERIQWYSGSQTKTRGSLLSYGGPVIILSRGITEFMGGEADEEIESAQYAFKGPISTLPPEVRLNVMGKGQYFPFKTLREATIAREIVKATNYSTVPGAGLYACVLGYFYFATHPKITMFYNYVILHGVAITAAAAFHVYYANVKEIGADTRVANALGKDHTLALAEAIECRKARRERFAVWVDFLDMLYKPSPGQRLNNLENWLDADRLRTIDDIAGDPYAI